MKGNIIFFIILYTMFCMWKLFTGQFEFGDLFLYFISGVAFYLDQFLQRVAKIDLESLD